ncbi:MAG TPA: cytochrome c [Vicinamibacteria bacterium]|nr:cytochrome c [Vicinamibacteria bacterium]
MSVVVLLLVVQPQFPATGDGLYRVACASCHGEDGRGVDPSQVGFDVPLPDFTDCSFATREPDVDWMAVTHAGGPVRGFSSVMPAYQEAFNPEQIQLILDHMRGFCPDDSWPRGELNPPLALETEKAYLEDEVVLSTSVESELFVTQFLYERRFGARNQWEGGLTFDSDGLSEVSFGVKRALHHSLERGSIVSVLGEVVFPAREDRTHDILFEPSILVARLLPFDSFVQFQGGVEVPEDAVFWRAALGKTFVSSEFGRTFTPMIEVVGTYEEERTDWTLLPQMQVSLNTRQHILANVGYRVAVNDRELRTDAVVFYVLWEWFDGGLLDGW